MYDCPWEILCLVELACSSSLRLPHASRRLRGHSTILSGLDTGMISGVAGNSPDVRVYKGIPFAAPPVGDLRFRAPQPPAKWGKGRVMADQVRSDVHAGRRGRRAGWKKGSCDRSC